MIGSRMAAARAAALLIGVAAASATASGDAPAPQDQWRDHPVNTWVRQSPREGRPPAPTLAYEGGGVYDPHTGKWIHHAGHEGIPQTERTFTYDLATGRWQQLFPNTSPPGACCVNNNGPCFDAANRRMIRFPAGSLGHGWQFSRSVYLKDAPASVWAYDPAANTWTAMRPPPYQAPKPYTTPWSIGGLCSVSTYDPVHEVVVHMPNNARAAEVYTYDVYANALDRFVGKNMPPQPRGAHGLAYDPRRGQLVLFGSGTGEDERTWFFDLRANAWEVMDLNPRPPCKREGESYATHPVMAYDSRNHVMLCVVWHPSDGSHETWVLDLEPKPAWTKMDPPTAPVNGSSRCRNLGYSPDHNVFILELVQAGSKTPNEIWTYRYKQPAPDKRPTPPSDLSVLTAAGEAALAWTASSTPNVREYRVYRAEAERAWEARYELLAKTAGTAFKDAGLAAGRVYFYKVSAVGADDLEGALSQSVRTQPRVLLKPAVSVLAKDRIEVGWNAHPAKDVVGYNVYRGLVTATTVKKGVQAPWRPNDPEYPEPRVNGVTDITGIERLNAAPIAGTVFTDTTVDLARKGPEAGDCPYAVYAYIVRAVNALGTESGPSPYALTIPSEPTNVLVRNTGGESWELKWDPNPEKGIVGYRVYSMVGSQVVRPLAPFSEEPIKTARFQGSGGQNLWVTAVDALGQEGQPSSPAKTHQRYKNWHEGEWHQ